MSYNNSRNYNSRNSGRFNRTGSFVPSSSTRHQTFDVPEMPQPRPAEPAPQPSPAEPAPQPEVKQDHSLKNVNEDVDMKAASAEEGASNSSRPPFFKSKLIGIKKISNKERRRRQNALLRRLTSPKNALMCINEMLPHEQITNQFKVEPTPQDGYFNNSQHNFCAELALEGVTYKGYGENKLSARNAAAEQAIRDIVLRKMARYSDLMAQHNVQDIDGAGCGGSADAAANAVDAILDADGSEALPMIQLLSFALHKLFAEWEGAGHHVPQLRARHASQPAVPAVSADKMSSEEGGAAAAPPAPPAPPAGPPKPRKPKKVPDNAAAMHPAMLLTVLRPHVVYRELEAEGDKPQNMIFTIAADIDDKTFIGKAPNKKEARKAAARAACKSILGITFHDEAPAAPAGN